MTRVGWTRTDSAPRSSRWIPTTAEGPICVTRRLAGIAIGEARRRNASIVSSRGQTAGEGEFVDKAGDALVLVARGTMAPRSSLSEKNVWLRSGAMIRLNNSDVGGVEFSR